MAKDKTGERTICENRRARREYEILDTLEAGIQLKGSEVKSLRGGHGSIAEAFVRVKGGEAWLMDANIPPYPQAGPHFNHEPVHPRKLLLKRSELYKWGKKIQEKGLTAIPLRVYLKGAWIKVEVALGKGRKLHDKRAAMKERDDRRETERALRRG